jgi:DNA-binding LacI/PurR family transcriptional regulator
LVAESLVLKGHSRIAFVIEEGQTVRDAPERLRLLRLHLASHGINIPNDFILPFDARFPEGLIRLMERSDGPTAVFAWRDFIAYFILENLESKGIRFPDDLSVIGYDGVHWPSKSSHIAASVKVDLYDLAAKSIELLDSVIAGKHGSLLELTQPVSFDPGTTFGPAKT